MFRYLIVASLLTLSSFQLTDRVRSFSGSGFVFQFNEPAGWILEQESVMQIADFVVFPGGSSWREASVSIFGHLVRRPPNVTSLEAYMEAERERYEQSCPLFDSQLLDLQSAGPHEFQVRKLECLGQADEVVAATEVTAKSNGRMVDYIFIFVLSAKQGSELKRTLPVLTAVLGSFRWIQRIAE